jgi:magnesium chelatase subunit I
MSDPQDVSILPYSYVVGQKDLKCALALNFVAPRIGGVLISGQRGTAKSTAVRAFCLMAYDHLPTTLPINATDDRVIGGWDLDSLMEGKLKRLPGLLEEADKGLLYIDEVNLLDDHIVNIILDVASTGVLTVQREAIKEVRGVSFSLVGTMNPEEGGLRPQLLDRFGLMIGVSELNPALRRAIVLRITHYDREVVEPGSRWIARGRRWDRRVQQQLRDAAKRFHNVELSSDVAQLCANVAAEFNAVGHRGEVVTALAAKALAALDGSDKVEARHIRKVAPMALQHRRPEAAQGGPGEWSQEDHALLDAVVERAEHR